MNINDVAKEHLNKMAKAIEEDLINQILPMEFNFIVGGIEVALTVNPGSEVIKLMTKKWITTGCGGKSLKKCLKCIMDLKAAPPTEAGGEPPTILARDYDADKASHGRERSEDLT